MTRSNAQQTVRDVVQSETFILYNINGLKRYAHVSKTKETPVLFSVGVHKYIFLNIYFTISESINYFL